MAWNADGKCSQIPMDAVQLNDIGMIAKGAQKHDFTKCSLGVSFITECIEYFLYGNDLLRFSINCLPNDAVCTFSQTLWMRIRMVDANEWIANHV